MTGLYGTTATKNTVAFFNATMLTPWTNFNRKLAGAIGLEWFYSEYDRAIANFNPEIPVTAQNQQFKKAFRVLRAYGLDTFLDQGVIDLRSITDYSEQPQLRSALIKFADETIIQPNPNKIPLWASGPIGAMVFQLKSYPLELGRLVHSNIKQAATVDPVTGGGRRIAPLVSLATVGPAAGAVALAAKDLAQFRGEDEKSELRERKLSNSSTLLEIAETLGFNERIHGDADEFLGWYFEGYVHLGGLGLLSNTLYDVAEQADNGTYGFSRALSTVFGPTVGTLPSIWNVGTGAGDALFADENGNGKERQAVRELAARIPVLGGMRNFKEGVVDAVAGEQEKRRTPSNPWTRSWPKKWN
jgi:hypothetical protein